MKTLALIMFAALSSIQAFSQDTLYTKSGGVISGKVTEISSDQIKYKKSSNADGPSYVLNKSDVVLIHYKNGSKDVFTATQNSGSDNTAINNNQSNNPAVVNNNYSSQGYVNPRPNVNVVVGAPFMGFRPFGWGWGGGYGYGYGYYRPYYHHNFYGRRGRHW